MYSISDWAILNDTKSKQLARIYREFHHLSETEITRACALLESYHAVYRRDRLKQRRNQLTSGQTRIKQSCLPPTATQLHEIADRVNARAGLKIETQEVKTQLENLAHRLRQYCIYVRAGLGDTGPWDEPNHRVNLDRIQPIQPCDSHNNGYTPFLQMYPI